jgi:G:T-mismatch repair DNA endonuclease (very short patch repair protein)
VGYPNKNYEFDIEKRLRQRRNFSKIARIRRRTTSSPNGVERKLWKALGSSFEFVGDGSFKIANLKPDFVNKTRKIVVELYGNYWHKDEPLEKTIRRVRRFENEGWRVVIIWEDEVHDPIKLRRKLAML